jgi:hypothetical protein
MDLLWHDDDDHRVEFVTGFLLSLACSAGAGRPAYVAGKRDVSEAGRGRCRVSGWDSDMLS